MNMNKPTLVVLGAVAAVLLLPMTAFADDPLPDDPTGVVVGGGASLQITQPVWLILTGLFLPIVVGLITKAGGSTAVKAVVGIVVAAIDALILRMTQFDGSAVFNSDYLLDVVMVYVPQLAAYLGFWRNMGAGGINAKLAPNTGIG